ncbi:MAG: ABC transporter ATP-binding protein/permease [Bacilli bacterium]
MKIQNLAKNYKTRYETVNALNGMTLEFPERGLVFIVGVSGSGKSTLMNMLSGVDTPTSGDIIVDEKNLFKDYKKQLHAYRNSYVGLIFQEYNLIDDMNVYDNIKLPLELLGETDFSIIDEVIKTIDIEDIKYSKVNEISSGQMQRVAIARALVKNSHIILADEPTGNLDSKNGKIVIETLQRISKERLVVVITHDDESAHEYGDRIIEIEDGSILNDTLVNPDINKPNKIMEPVEFHEPEITFRRQIKFTKDFIRGRVGRSIAILLLMIIIPIIGNVLCGYAFFNVDKSYSKYQDEYGSEYVMLADTYSGYTVNYDTDEFIRIEEEYVGSNLLEVYGTNYYIDNSENKPEDKIYKNEINNIIVDDNGTFNYIDGSKPFNENEIAITDYFKAAYFYYTGDEINPGDSLKVNGVSFFITGLVQTSYLNYLDYDESDLFTSMAFKENLAYYAAFYMSTPGRIYWENNMTYYIEEAKLTVFDDYNNKTVTNIQVLIRKWTAEPVLLAGDDYTCIGRYGYASENLWSNEMGNSLDDSIGSTSISFICTARSKYTFTIRVSGIYKSSATSFDNILPNEVMVDEERFDYFRTKQAQCKFLINSDDVNYKEIIENENVVNQSFTYAAATWQKAESSKYVMIEFLLTMILITAVFSFAINSITLNTEMKKMGIKYSFGIKKKTIVAPYWIELIVDMILGLVISVLVTRLLYPLIMNKLIFTTIQENTEYYFFYIGIGSLLGWDLFIYAIMSISLLWMVNKIFKKSPIEMIKDL